MKANNVIKIEVEIDLDAIKKVVDKAKDLNDNEELFSQLIEFERAKKQAQDVLDQIKSIEENAKGIINAKATALYGAKWEAVKGHNYKITNSPTGSIFNIAGKVQRKFLIVKESVNTKVVNQYIKDKGRLPIGLDYNPDRGSSIRINVHEDDKA